MPEAGFPLVKFFSLCSIPSPSLGLPSRHRQWLVKHPDPSLSSGPSLSASSTQCHMLFGVLAPLSSRAYNMLNMRAAGPWQMIIAGLIDVVPSHHHDRAQFVDRQSVHDQQPYIMWPNNSCSMQAAITGSLCHI
jgi:hypothetical protein